MSLLLMRGVAKLSQLEIDANKDWQAREITNLKTIAGAMDHGDIAFRGAGVLPNALYPPNGPGRTIADHHVPAALSQNSREHADEGRVRRNGPRRLPRGHKVGFDERGPPGRRDHVPTAGRLGEGFQDRLKLRFLVRVSSSYENPSAGAARIVASVAYQIIIIHALTYFKQFKGVY